MLDTVTFKINMQACKTAIRESIEAEIRREREYRDNPEMVCRFHDLEMQKHIACRKLLVCGKLMFFV